MADGELTIYYWPAAGRGEFIRLILEEAGVPYKEVNDVNIMREQIIAGTFPGYPHFAPPLIMIGDFTLSQTPVICRYLGKKHGLWPKSEADEWHADQVNATIHDFIAEGHLVFHAKAFTERYFTQKEETQGHIDWFKSGRLQHWLSSLEASLAANNGGQGFVVGNSMTYVDLALLHILRAASSQFPDEWHKMDNIPLLKAFKDRMSARPNLQAYFSSDRCRPFAGISMM